MLNFIIKHTVDFGYLFAVENGYAYTIKKLQVRDGYELFHYHKNTNTLSSPAEFSTLEAAMKAANRHAEEVKDKQNPTYRLCTCGNDYPTLKIIVCDDTYRIERRPSSSGMLPLANYRMFKNGVDIGQASDLSIATGHVFFDAGIEGPSFENFELVNHRDECRLFVTSGSQDYRISADDRWLVGRRPAMVVEDAAGFSLLSTSRTLPHAMREVRTYIKKDRETKRSELEKKVESLQTQIEEVQKELAKLTK